jgi:hypothetical protein
MSLLLESLIDDERRAECALHDAELAAADLEMALGKGQRKALANDRAAVDLQQRMADCEPRPFLLQ